jgi:tetratricopeptide (TPR) repeat protein
VEGPRGTPAQPPPTPEARGLLVGRSGERLVLASAIAGALRGRGSVVLVEGPSGIGKTHLARWAQEEGDRLGMSTFWGSALREVSTPFFPFQQIFSKLGEAPAWSQELLSRSLPSPLPAVVLLEGIPPELFWETAARSAADGPALLVGRDRPATVRQKHPKLPTSTPVVWLSKSPGEGAWVPDQLDGLGDRLRTFYAEARGGGVWFSGLDYLCSHNGFPPVLRLVQFLRDCAEEHDGHLFLAVNPAAFDARERALLEAESHVVHDPGTMSGPSETAGSPTATLIQYLDLLEVASRRRPLLLVVDDLQWSDPDSLRAFQFLARNLRKLPVLLLATRRLGEGAAVDPAQAGLLEEVLQSAEREGTLVRINLVGMSRGEAHELARTVLGNKLAFDPEDPRLEDLVRRCEGNPFFLRETLVRLSTEGRLRLTESGWAFSAAGADWRASMLPDTLQRVLARRLDRLTLEELDLLRWAAIIGREFDLPPLESLAASSSVRPDLLLERLAKVEGLVERVPPTGWTFVHPMIWEVVLAGTPLSGLEDRAGRLGEWWADRRSDDLDRIARLFHDARDPTHGLPWVRKAIVASIRSRQVEPVGRYYRWLQDLLDLSGANDRERCEAGLDVVRELYRHSGTTLLAAEILRGLRGLPVDPALTWEMDAYFALTVYSFEPKEARLVLNRLLTDAAHAPPAGPARAIGWLAATAFSSASGRLSDAIREGSACLDTGDSLPDWIRVRACNYVGVSFTRQGNPEAARRLLEMALPVALATGNEFLVGYCRNLEAFIAEVQGDVRGLRRAHKAALDMIRSVGTPIYLTVSLSNLGEAEVYCGDLRAARATVRELRKQAERFAIGSSLTVQLPHLEGIIALRDGQSEEALRHLQAAYEAMERTEGTDERDIRQIDLAEACLARGRVGQARMIVETVRGHGSNLPSYVRPVRWLVDGRCSVAEGDPERGRAAFERAFDEARAVGHLFNQGLATNHLARWEEEFGDRALALRLRSEATALFDASGVEPDGWARSWPPFLGNPPSAPP